MKRMIMCAEANQIDLVDFLQNLSYQPQKIRGNDYWYLSPFRQEKTPSFKVNRKLNLWYDHGAGKGGNLVDFGVQFYGCSVPEFLQKLREKSGLPISFQPPHPAAQSTRDEEEKKLKIIAVDPIIQPRFFRYLHSRKIDPEIAKSYLSEVRFELHDKLFSALGFRNNSGGYELRNEYFKGSSSPKDVTLFDQASENVAVFEGCFSFLSYLSFIQKNNEINGLDLSERQTNYLVLNSLSFFERSRNLMESHAHALLYLDRDVAGLKATERALIWSMKYKDKSLLYRGHKDLNDFLIHGEKQAVRQRQSRGRHL